METHLDEGRGLGHELTGEGDEEVGSITSLVVLHLGSLGNHLGGGMVDVGLSNDGGGVRGDEKLLEVVEDHLVHAYEE